MSKILITGNKALKIRMEDLSEEAWTYITGGSEGGEVKDYFQSVPWLYRGVTVRAQTVASMPFAVMRGETEVVVSDQYEDDELKDIMPHPKLTLHLIEAALSLLGYAYLEKTANLANTKTMGMKWLMPTSIKPKITEDAGLVGFTRGLANEQIVYPPEEILHFWFPDPFVEIGQPLSSPAKAALQAAGVLYNVDKFVAEFFDHGAIKATILSVPSATPPSAKAELQSLWDRFMSGIANAWSSIVINADAVTPVQVGEGVSELSDSELTTEKRQDISTALGIPQSILFSDAANFAVAKEDNLHFYDKTIVPECEFIQDVLNEQVFDPMGLRWEFRPETLDIMQEDEKERAMALGYLYNAEVPLDMAFRILGFELSDEDWKRIEEQVEKKEERADQMVEQLGSNNGGGVAFQPEDPKDKPDPFVEKSLGADLEQWKDKAIGYMKRGKPGKGRKYESENIPPALAGAIAGALEEAETEEAITAVFEDIWMGYP
jgi:HK97 family phage portal protein